MDRKQCTDYADKKEYIMNADLRELLGISSATANRILSGFVNDGKLIKVRLGKTWAYAKKSVQFMR